MKRITITFPDDMYSAINKLRGQRIALSGKPLAFGTLVNELVSMGLEKVKSEEKSK